MSNAAAARPPWSWSPPTLLASVPSRTTLLADARRRQAVLVRQWSHKGQAMLIDLERTLLGADISAAEVQAELVRTTAPLGHLIHPRTGLGPRRRSPRSRESSEELQARLVHVGQQAAAVAAAAAAATSANTHPSQ